MKIKKIIAAILCITMLLGMAACAGGQSASSPAPAAAGQNGPYTDGTFEASAYGMNGDVPVTVVVEGGNIVSVTIGEHKETDGIGTNAVDALPDAIVAANSPDVDAVSGATVTSNAIIKAVKMALGLEEDSATASVTGADIVIVGGGAAGLAAAITACDNGASVIVLEANGRTGGSATLSGGNTDSIADSVLAGLGRNDADLEVYLTYKPEDFPAEYADDLAKVQADVAEYMADPSIARAYDSVERIMIDHYVKGKGTDVDGVPATLDYDYIRKAIEENIPVYDWLCDMGVTYKEPSAKHYVTPNGKGAELMDMLLAEAEAKGAVVHLNTRGIELVTDDTGRVTGVVAETANGNVTYTADKGVILATGSYSANNEMVQKYQRSASSLGGSVRSSNPDTNIGDGIVMAEGVGAQLCDMQFISWMFYGYDKKAGAGDMTAAMGATQLAVNNDGVRFTDDTDKGGMNNAFYRAVLPQPDVTANLLGDKAMADALEEKGLLSSLTDAGILFQADTLEELAEKAGVNAEALKETIERFNAAVDAGTDPDFGRTQFNGKVLEAPFVIVKGQPIAHLTFGGLVTDLEARVLKEDGSVIPGLYAAGDVVAGFEGANHESGDCLTIVMYYGQVAGKNAAAEK